MNYNPKTHNPIPESGYLRLGQILGNPKTGTIPIIPVSKSTWYQGVKEGRYPKPHKLSERCSAWLASDITDLLNQLKGREW